MNESSQTIELKSMPNNVEVLQSIEVELDNEDADFRRRDEERAADIVANTDILSLPWLFLEQRHSLPNVPGIYFVLEDNRVIYIGRSQRNILRRWWTHSKIKELKERTGQIKIAWLKCDAVLLLPVLESALIARFGKPEMNRKMGDRIVPIRKPGSFFGDELDDNIQRRLVALRRTDWELVEEVASKLQLSPDEALMWIIRLGAVATPRRYERMLKKLERDIKN